MIRCDDVKPILLPLHPCYPMLKLDVGGQWRGHCAGQGLGAASNSAFFCFKGLSGCAEHFKIAKDPERTERARISAGQGPGPGEEDFSNCSARF